MLEQLAIAMSNERGYEIEASRVHILFKVLTQAVECGIVRYETAYDMLMIHGIEMPRPRWR